jgi:methylenetetrahydrofolate dehydrogenase (NADP+)/methenyltetrahydrofolate cyclohydrolase
MVIDGRKISQEILEKLKDETAKLNFQPVFCDVLVGSDPVSAQYVRMKGKLAKKIGMRFRRADYPASITTQELVKEIEKINQEPNLCGLVVQLPLPEALNRAAVLNAINPRIDVDCTGEVNAKKFYEGKPYLVFPTAAAVMAILDSLHVDLAQKQFAVIGQGQLVGKPVTFLLRQRDFQVHIADINTTDISVITKNADVVITAVGKGKLITGGIIKTGSIIIDAGTSELAGGIVGDVDFESVRGIAGFISPVPGGVGPVTVAMLLKNILTVARNA